MPSAFRRHIDKLPLNQLNLGAFFDHPGSDHGAQIVHRESVRPGRRAGRERCVHDVSLAQIAYGWSRPYPFAVSFNPTTDAISSATNPIWAGVIGAFIRAAETNSVPAAPMPVHTA